MTKWKGRVASTAPCFGRIVPALGAAASPLLLAAAMLTAPAVLDPELVGGEARAANECGVYTAPNGTITCNLTTYTTGPNDDIAYSGVDGITLNLNDAAMDVTTATTAVTVTSNATSSNPITINGTSFRTISTTNTNAHGIYASTGSASNVSMTLTSGAIATSGQTAHGAFLYGSSASTGGITAVMDGGSISTSGAAAMGMYLNYYGLGALAVTMNGGSITTTGAELPAITPVGIRANLRNTSSTSTLTFRMTGGSITAAHHGMSLTNAGSGATNVFMTGGTVTNTGSINNGAGYSITAVRTAPQSFTMSGGRISTAAFNGNGVAINAFGGSNSTVTISDGTIATTGDVAEGIRVWNPFGANTSTVNMSGGTITASGNGANGIGVIATGTGASYLVSVTGGSVTSGTGQAAGIHTAGSSGGTINIGSAATINGSASGIAIRDGDFNLFGGTISDGVDEIGGNVVVTTAGTVTGNAILGLGNDTFNLTGGTYTGDIYGDDVVAAAGDGDDTFNWSGGVWNSSFFGGNGSDTANITAPTYDGTHHVLNGGDDLSRADGWVDTLTLNGITSNANGANIINWEVATLDNTTLTIVDGAWAVGEATDATTGVFLTNGSTLDGGATLALAGNMSIDATSTFRGLGAGVSTYSISGGLVNAGVVTTQDGVVGDTVTVGGNYSGTGQLLVDVDFSTDTSDTLVVGGNITGGATTVVVNDVTGGTATGNDVLVVDVEGTTAAGDFQLSGGTVVSGAYRYALVLIGSDWYLSTALLPQVVTYEAYPQHLLALNGGVNGLPTMRQRVGNRYWRETAQVPEPEYVFCKDPSRNFLCQVTPEQTDDYADNAASGGAAIEGSAVWGRITAAHSTAKPSASTTSATYEHDLWGLRAGIDALVGEDEAGARTFVGLTAHYGRAESDISSSLGDGSIKTDGYGFGLTATWFAQDGFYVDAQGAVTWFDSDLLTSLGSVTGNDGVGYALSLEAGKRIGLRDSLTVTPQAQLIYAAVDFDDFTGPSGEPVSLDAADSLKGRLGVSLDRDEVWSDDLGRKQRLQVYAIANLYYEFLDGTTVNVSGTELKSELDAWTGEAGLGLTRNWNDDRFSLYGEVSVASSLENFGESYRFSGTAGGRVRW